MLLLLDLGSLSLRNYVKGVMPDLAMQFCVNVSGQPYLVRLACNSISLL